MSLTGVQIESSKIFLALGIFDALRVTLCLFFPLAITYGSESLLSLKRIQVEKFYIIFDKLKYA